MSQLTLPEEDSERGRYPLADGLFDYFPNALCAVAEVSKHGNDKHNPGEPMHHARGKSTDHRNKILRHLLDTGSVDSAGLRHSAYVAWRALALLQEEIEAQDGAPMARGARAVECRIAGAIMPEIIDEVPRMPTAGGHFERNPSTGQYDIFVPAVEPQEDGHGEEQ